MRPYLAIIRDSFHEALVSRVLWILLLLTTLLLLALAPLGFIEEAGSHLSEDDILSREKLATRIVKQGKSSDPSPGRRIWELLDDGTKQMLARYAENPQSARLRTGAMVDALQSLIERRDFYRAEDWANIKLPTPARNLYAKGLKELPDDELARFNRLALDAAYPDELAPIGDRQVQLAYFHWELGLTLPVEPEQLFPAINQLLVATLGILLGVAGVFVAVMVTASMIPQAFEAGSVDLLLSKPIDRGLLFLAKFVGGCAFIAINAAYFIGGLWLLLGVRLGLWNERLLLAIPLYLFLFAIYYAVSSLAGVVWRNAIVSVVMAVLFWFVCWVLGTANQVFEQLALNPRRLMTVVPAGEDLIAVSFQGDVFRWDKTESDWQKIFASRSDTPMPFMIGGRMVGPVYDAKGERILAVNLGFPGFSPMQASNRLLIGKRAEDWRREEGVNVPDGSAALLLGPANTLLTANAQGLYRLEGDLAARQEDINIFGLHVPLPQRGGRFANVGPEVSMRPLESAAIDPASGRIVLYDGHRLALFAPDDQGKYALSKDLPFERKLTGKAALAGETVLLVLDGEVRRYGLDLKLQDTMRATTNSPPQAVQVSPDGRVAAVVYRDGQLWLYDAAENKPLEVSVAGQGDVSAVAFDGNAMYVADRLTRVTEYELPSQKVDQRWQAPLPLAEKIYRYALHPLYTVFPKPGQLNQTVMYLLTSKDTTPGAIRLDDGNGGPQKLDVWGPIWSNSVFLVIVLAIACVYVYRKDF